MRNFLMCFLLVLVVLSFSSCGAKEEGEEQDGKVTINVMHYYTKEESEFDNTRKIPRETLYEYMDSHSDIEFNLSEMQINDYETKMQALAAANDLPDVFLVKGSWIGTFAKNGLLASLNDTIDTCGWKEQYRDGLFFSTTLEDGTIVAAPMQFSTTSIVYYNKELWNQAGYSEFPKTWEEIFSAVPKFETLGIDTIEFGNNAKWQFNSSWASTLGPRVTGVDWVNNIIAKNGQAAFTDTTFIDFLELVVEIGSNGVLNVDYPTIGHQKASSLFLQGKAATMIDGYWNIAYTESTASEEMLNNIELAYMPTVEHGVGDPTSIASGAGWFIAVNGNLEGKKLEMAKKMAIDLSGPKMSQKLSNVGLIGGCRTMPESGITFSNLIYDFNDFVTNASSSVPIWDANMDAPVIAVMNDQFVGLLAGNTTPQKAAQAIQIEYEANM